MIATVTPAVIPVLRRVRWLRGVGRLDGAAIALAGLWAARLVRFAASLPGLVEDPLTATDAIVALSGGRQRVENALALLADGKATKLFVSGVHPGIDTAEILKLAPQTPRWTTCCIVLGHAADNTLGNAQETAEWMRREGFRSLRLVTASYHMPRSLLEFRRAMPEATIIAHPVFPERVRQSTWWVSPGTASLIVGEYTKFLGALARPMLPVDAVARHLALS